MTAASEPKHPTLRAVYWREEVIEVVLWLRGGGMDERLDAGLLGNYLGVAPEEAAAHLQRLTDQGYLLRLPDGRFGLSAAGEDEGRRLVAGSRAVPLAQPGRCGPECWCSTSPTEAAQCGDVAIG